MINIVTLSSLALATLHMAVAPASAHGYVSHPPSRQVRCRDDQIPGCGPVKYDPHSVEAWKGSFSCNGDGPNFPELNDDALWEPYFFSVAPDDDPLYFTWTLPVPHRTTTWEYFVLTENNALLTSFNDYNTTPPATVVHEVPLNGYTGRQTVLARWNIGDTEAAFYSCVDLYIDPKADAAAAQQPIGI
jgi:predicted carbohydrate-binding protein with CBM5 and CBM33 domain